MSMSMYMNVPIIPTTTPVIPTTAPVSPVLVSAAPVHSDSPSVSSAPTKAPNTTIGVMEVATSALLSDGGSVSVSGSPGSTAFVVMASAGGIALAALATSP